MLFFLDENFPLLAIDFLTKHSHEAVRCLDYFPQGTPDDVLFDKAENLRATFLSTDKDFFHTVPLTRPNRAIAVVAFTLSQPSRSKILERLQAFLATVPEILPGDVFLITDKRIIKKR
jgi:hypothetical protein